MLPQKADPPVNDRGWTLVSCLSIFLLLITLMSTDNDPDSTVEELFVSSAPVVAGTPVPTRTYTSRVRSSSRRGKAVKTQAFLDFFGGKKDSADREPTSAKGKFYELSATDIDGKKIDFSRYRGKVSLIVNVASQ